MKNILYAILINIDNDTIQLDDDKFDNNSYEEISKTIDKRIKQIEDISNHLKRIVGIVENKDLALIIK